MPETSIIIRTFNEEKHIEHLLSSLEKQSYRDFEVIIVDSESSDRTVEIAKRFKTQIISIKSRDFTFGYSLNVGCAAALGKYLVFVSAHTLPYDADWLGNLVRGFGDDRVAMIYGGQRAPSQSKFSERRDLERLFGKSPSNAKAPLNYANNANAAIRKSLWERHPFDEYLFGLEDIDWSRWVTKEGYEVRYEPNAKIFHIHEESWAQVFNRYRREAIAAVRIGLKEPPQARLGTYWFIFNVLFDALASFPKWTRSRIEEIVRFRYYQWKGSRVGWRQGQHLDVAKDKQSVFNPVENYSVVIEGKHQAELKETALPEMKPGDLLIKVAYVGVCRTDLEVLEGTLGYYRDGVAQYPIVPGHEFSGTIVRIGSNNRYQERFKVGEKVVGECILSRDPRDRKEVGVINYNGAYSTHIVVPGDSVHKIPSDLSLEKATLAEPLAVVLRAIRRIRHRLKTGAPVAVIGAGTIGHLCAQTLARDGYSVTVFDKDERRLAFLKDRVASVSTELGKLDQFDAIFEATGSKEALEQAIQQSRTDATLMLLGFPYGALQYNFEDLVGQEKVFAGSVGADREDFIEALKVLPNIDLRSDMFLTLPLSEFRKAWDLHRSSSYLKLLLRP